MTLDEALAAAPRHRPRTLVKADVPSSPGVYAWYRDGELIYSGRADSLVRRLWANQVGHSGSLGSSAFRRVVAERLGIASAAQIRSGRYVLTDDELARVRAWILGCEVAWVEVPRPPAVSRP